MIMRERKKEDLIKEIGSRNTKARLSYEDERERVRLVGLTATLISIQG